MDDRERDELVEGLKATGLNVLTDEDIAADLKARGLPVAGEEEPPVHDPGPDGSNPKDVPEHSRRGATAAEAALPPDQKDLAIAGSINEEMHRAVDGLKEEMQIPAEEVKEMEEQDRAARARRLKEIEADFAKRSQQPPPKPLPDGDISPGAQTKVNIPIVNTQPRVGNQVALAGSFKGSMCLTNSNYRIKSIKANGDVRLKRIGPLVRVPR